MDKLAFINAASDYIDLDNVPSFVVKAAHNIYNELPPNSAEWLLRAYDATDDANAKLAFEIVGATMIKQANPLALAGAAIRGVGGTIAKGAGGAAKEVGLHTAFAAPGLVSKATESSTTVEQGSNVTKSVENGVVH